MSTNARETLNKKKILNHPRTPEQWTEAIAAFENELYRCGRAEPTVATYTSALRTFERFYRDALKKPGPYVARLQETDLNAFVVHLRSDRKLSATSVNRYVVALRAFASFLLAKGWHRRMLARDLKTYRPDRSPELPRLSNAELRRLVTSVEKLGRNGLRDLAMLQIFLQCGLRVSELARLCRDDVTIHKSTGKLRVRNEKGHKERIVPLNTTARLALTSYLDTRGPVVGSEPLFISEQRKPISIKAIQYQIKKYLSAAGREELSTHDLRHHFALKFYERSGKLTSTQQVLGHRDINTTARYAKVSDKEIEETIDAIDDES